MLRMSRSRSRNRLIETAFVSSTRSSTEDIDEVDRLANHPVLRSSSRGSGKLKKSRSEMGCGTNYGLSGGVASTSWQFCPTASREGSPTSNPSPPTRGMTRTITFHANLSAVLTTPTTSVSKSAPSTPPTWTTDSMSRPTPSIHINPSIKNDTPPNTAPLPTKFSRLLSSRSNPLRQSSSSTECRATKGDNASSSPLLRFPLSLKSRFRQRVLSKSISIDSSSTESSPQRIVKLPQRLGLKKSQQFSHEDSSSSAMSSTESVTDASEMDTIVVHNANNSLRFAGNNKAKKGLQILSPISDKSQEQGDDYEAQNNPEGNFSNRIYKPKNDNDNVINNNNNNNSELDNVPWDMPKLRRRLMQAKTKEASKTSSIQGSDSGISMTSQDMKDLLNVPWDMPKLRRKQFIVPGGRPVSVPNDNVKTIPPATPSCSNPSLAFPSEKWNLPDSNLNLKPPPIINKTEEVGLEPPRGFEDEYYLTETQPQNFFKNTNSRPRPKMTLSFGVDPSKKTLMFSTNSPFDLNDCDEINPSIPLNRQDWYHGGITKEDAEKTLKSLSEGSYLVRNLDYSTRQEYALSIKSSRGYMHMRIKRDPASREFTLSNFPRKFVTIPQMIHHYTLNRLPIKGAEHMCLKTPVNITLL